MPVQCTTAPLNERGRQGAIQAHAVSSETTAQIPVVDVPSDGGSSRGRESGGRQKCKRKKTPRPSCHRSSRPLTSHSGSFSQLAKGNFPPVKNMAEEMKNGVCLCQMVRGCVVVVLHVQHRFATASLPSLAGSGLTRRLTCSPGVAPDGRFVLAFAHGLLFSHM